MQISHQYYQVNGITLHTAEAGRADGNIILFLHGFPEYWYGWKAQLEYFADKGYRAVAPDQRGYNLSSKPDKVSSYRVGELVNDVVALIRQLTDKKIILVAHDWGGIIAWKIAALHPLLLQHLVILNIPHPAVMEQTLKKNFRQLLKSWYIGFFQLPLLPEWLSSVSDFASLQRSLVKTSRPGTFSKADIEQYKTAWKQPGAIGAMINWYRAFVMHGDAPIPPGRITVPTLMIWGKKDAFLSHEMARPSIELCVQGKLVMMEDNTHWVHHEEAAVVNQLVYNFIR